MCACCMRVLYIITVIYVYLCECLYQCVSWRGLNIAFALPDPFIMSCDE